jgi:hypothetical protein
LQNTQTLQLNLNGNYLQKKLKREAWGLDRQSLIKREAQVLQIENGAENVS